MIKEDTYIMRHEVGEVRLCKTLSEEITHMTETEEDEEAYVGGEEDIVWGLLHGVVLDRLSVVMLGGATISLVRTVTKLCVNCVEDLLRGWRSTRICETVVLVVLIEKRVLR
jgi:hypothetical protein